MSTASIKLWGQDVGAVTWLKDRGYAVFEYEPSFLTKGLETFSYPSQSCGRKGRHYFFFPKSGQGDVQRTARAFG